MFKNEFQGGAVVDIFSAQGRDPLAKWKLHGGPSAVCKNFDKAMKGFVYILQGSSQTNKIQMPKDNKMTLGLIQRFLVLQVYIPLGKDFSTELMVTDLGNLKRRLYLSTVHKEFCVTPLHARIPLSNLRRSIWCNMCIDLVSFTGEVFKGAAFLSLDGIAVSASCRLRRIFTMKQPSMEAFNEDSQICGNNLMDVIPRSFQFPSDVQHVTQLVNIEFLRLVEIKSFSPSSSDCEQSHSVRTSSTRGTKRQDVTHIAFGSKVQGPPLPTGRKNSMYSISEGSGSNTKTSGRGGPARSTSQDSMEDLGLHSGPVPITRLDLVSQTCPESRSPCQGLSSTGHNGPLQPHPPPDKMCMARAVIRKLQAYSTGGEKPVLTGAAPVCSTKGGGEPEGAADSTAWSTKITGDWASDETEGQSRRDHSTDMWGFPDGLVDCGSQGSELDPQLHQPCADDSLSPRDGDQDEEAEPELNLRDFVTFSSKSNYAKRLLGHSHVPEITMCSSEWRSDEGRVQRGARMEDDFIVSGSEEDEANSEFYNQRPAVQSNSDGAGSLAPAENDGDNRHNADDTLCKLCPESQVDPSPANTEVVYISRNLDQGTQQTSVVPVRSLSPSRNRLGHSLENGAQVGLHSDCTRTSLREILAPDRMLHVETTTGDENKALSIGTGSSEMCNLNSLRMHEEEEELQMLASLRRQQEDEELQEGSHTAGLSASQIHKCNVSMSTSSDDTSTWNPALHMPSNQGHHYQTEMDPLLHSNPRDWLDVFSPPILPPSEQMRGKGKGDDCSNNMKGGEVVTNKTEGEDEFLTLLYDPCLNCYFDPETGKYYELA